MSRPAENMNNKDIAPWGAILACLVLVGVWFMFHTQISTAVLWVRWVEAHLMVFDPDGQQAMAQWLGTTTAKETTIAGIIQSGEVAGYSLRWFSLAILVAIFSFLILKSPARGGRYSQRHDMRSLAKQEAQMWPAILPVVSMDMAKVSLDDPVLGMRTAPRTYAKNHQLLLPRWTTQQALGELGEQVRQLDDRRYLRVDQARKVFAAQIGRRWEGVDRLRPYERALFAAFAAQINHDRDTCEQILDACARAAFDALAQKDLDALEPAQVGPALDKYGASDIVKKILLQHAYVRTALMHMLQSARKNGVIAPARFLWLKRADRLTWYCLDDLGMGSSVETGGVRAHYLAERKARVAIIDRMVEPAIVGFIDELNRFLDEEDQEEDV